MAKYKPYNFDQMVMIPISLENQFEPGKVGDQTPNLIDEMKAKIDTTQGKRIYAKRLAIVEPVFANICVQKRLNRFTLRTKSKVDVRWRLFALVHKMGIIYVVKRMFFDSLVRRHFISQ
jgi:hypothetical protein